MNRKPLKSGTRDKKIKIMRDIRVKIFLKAIFVVLSLSIYVEASASIIDSLRTPGPNLLLTRKRIEEVKTAISLNNQLAIKAYSELIETAKLLLNTYPNPIRGSVKAQKFYKYTEEQRRVSRQIGNDAVIAYTLALAYAFSGDKIYADKSREFLEAWMSNCTIPEDGGDLLDILMGEKEGDTALVISYHFPKFIMAFDILKGLNALSKDDIIKFNTWLRPFIEYLINYKPVLPNNHLSWKAVFLLCAGRATEDQAVLNEGVKELQTALSIQILCDGSMPLELIRQDRSASYTLMNLEALVQAIWIAENHNIKLRETRSLFGGNIELACNNFKEFLVNRRKWQDKYKILIQIENVNYPDDPADWAWVFEIPLNWIREDSPLAIDIRGIIGDRIYSLYPPRSYTMQFATLLFRKFLQV